MLALWFCFIVLQFLGCKPHHTSSAWHQVERTIQSVGPVSDFIQLLSVPRSNLGSDKFVDWPQFE